VGTEEVLARQTTLYGEPLGARFARLLTSYGIPQSRLAAVIGLSAPMLSQLASGQRVKITNPAVYARLLRLEDLARRTTDPAVLQAALEDVAASRPTLTAEPTRAVADDERDRAIGYLSRIAPPGDLVGAAAATDGPLAELLRLAAAEAGRR
jgi:transcriptional regulator with XRE-family HTH domain